MGEAPGVLVGDGRLAIEPSRRLPSQASGPECQAKIILSGRDEVGRM